eukprot:scaffold9529_cov80-Skeletonema_menzelii.AAC.4
MFIFCVDDVDYQFVSVRHKGEAPINRWQRRQLEKRGCIDEATIMMNWWRKNLVLLRLIYFPLCRCHCETNDDHQAMAFEFELI